MQETSLFTIVLENIQDGVYYIDREGRVLLWNTAAEQYLGYTMQELQGNRLEEFLFCATPDGDPLWQESNPAYAVLQNGALRRGELLMRDKQGVLLPFDIRLLPVYSKDAMVGVTGIFTPLQQHTAQTTCAEEERDFLTDLPDAEWMEQMLEKKLQKEDAGQYCLLLAQIDNFELFTDTYGEEAADRALQTVAKSLGFTLGCGYLTAWGEDAFAYLCKVDDGGQCTDLAEKMRKLVSATAVVVEDDLAQVTASVGAVVAQPNQNIDELILQAEGLMAQSRQRGKNRATILVPEK